MQEGFHAVLIFLVSWFPHSNLLRRGKSGGFRVIYYRSTPEVVYLLLAYPKNKQDNLTKAEVKLLRGLIED